MRLILVGRKRDGFLNKTFDKVVDLRFDRILGRVHSPWLPQPVHYILKYPGNGFLARVRASQANETTEVYGGG
jgi:hypothetical protein